MFLPNSHSFLLVRSVKPVIHPVRSLARAKGASETSNGIQSGRKMFLPNTYSFLLIRRAIIEPSFTPEVVTTPQSTDGEQPKVSDQGKRNFLKVAGVAGAGLAASLLLPKKADALIMGSSPTTGVVGVKNVANTRINPATQETVSTLLKTSDLTFDTGSLQVKVTSLPPSSFSDSGSVAKSGLVDADRHVQVDVLSSALPTTASTENTLTTISYGGRKFTLRLVTVGSIDYVGEAEINTATNVTGWRIKRIHNNYDGNSNISIAWADGNANFDNTFDSYAGYTYS